MRRSLPWLIALAGGLLAAYVDLHVGDDPWITAIVLLFIGGALGLVARAGWRWAILLGLFVPGAELFSVLTVGAPSYTPQHAAESFIAVGFAVAGALLGAISVGALGEDGYTLRP